MPEIGDISVRVDRPVSWPAILPSCARVLTSDVETEADWLSSGDVSGLVEGVRNEVGGVIWESATRSSGSLATLLSLACPGREPTPTLDKVLPSVSCEGREVSGFDWPPAEENLDENFQDMKKKRTEV